MRYTQIKSAAGQRELRRLQRRHGTDIWLLAFVLVAVAFVYLTFTLGRAYRYSQQVETFVATLDQQSSAQVKDGLHRFADGLSDPNPLIRRGAMAAFRAATGWRLGPNANEWRQTWEAREEAWEYRRTGPTNHPPSAVFVPD